jgi:hypothetical protein
MKTNANKSEFVSRLCNEVMISLLKSKEKDKTKMMIDLEQKITAWREELGITSEESTTCLHVLTRVMQEMLSPTE